MKINASFFCGKISKITALFSCGKISNIGKTSIFTTIKKALQGFWAVRREGIKAVIYVVAIAALWSVAIWDASNVISNYLFDNSATLVTGMEIKSGNREFVENAIVCVTYSNSIFERLWWNDSKVKEEFDDAYNLTIDNWNLTRRVFESIDFKANNASRLTNRQYIHALKIIRHVIDEDRCNKERSLVGTTSACVNKKVDEFWTDDQLNKLKDSVWKLFDEASAQSPYASLRSCNIDQICYNISVEKAVTLKGTISLLPIGLMSENEQIAEENFENNKPLSIAVAFPDFNVDVVISSTVRFNTIAVLITTRGVFDRQDIKNCYGPGVVPQIYKSCLDNHYVQMVKDHCHCTPFLFRDPGNGEHQNYCTSKNYENCPRKISNDLSRYTCEHCLLTQNSYTISNTKGKSEYPNVTDNDLHIYFAVTDTFYARYEVKTPTSWYQTMAQVGGDIGFYTGFSMWAFWKFVMFVSSTHRNRRRAKVARKKISTVSVPTNPNQASRKMSRFGVEPADLESPKESWFGVAYNYWREGDSQFKQHRSEKENKERLKDRLRRLEEATMLAVATIEQMKQSQNNQQTGATVVNMP